MGPFGLSAGRWIPVFAAFLLGCGAQAEDPLERVGEGEGALTISIVPIRDTTLLGPKPLGTHQLLRVGSASLDKSIVQFDTAAMTSALGPGGTAASATLAFTLKSLNNIGTGITLDLSQLTVPWTESEATQFCAVDTNPANPSPDCTGPNVWNLTVGPGITNPWVNPPTAQKSIAPGTPPALTFDVTADVNEILDGTAINAGWIIGRTDTSSAIVTFGSRESLTPPTLTIVAGPCKAGFAADAAGVCIPAATCAVDTADCDNDGTCETAIDTTSNCGACGVTCPSTDTCAPAACVAGLCQTVFAPDGTTCSSNVCSVGDVCQGGACLPPSCPSSTGTCTLVPNCQAGISVPAEPSLIVTRLAHSLVLDRFGVDVVFEQLIALTGTATPTTPLSLFQQLWDTQSQKASSAFPTGPYHCDDNGSKLNGYSITCPRKEGQLAFVDMFVNPTTNNDAFIPTALVNRFDLAKPDGSTCGEYRIAYAKRSGLTDVNDRVGLILELELPNPSPECGIEACRPIQEMWANLANITDETALGDQLVAFYFQGLPGFRPVIHPKNLGLDDGTCGTVGGQLRTNEFMDTSWQMRQYTLERLCDGVTNELVFKPVPVTNTPHKSLFAPNGSANNLAFQAALVSQVAPLGATALEDIRMSIPTTFLAGESVALLIAPDNYAAILAQNPGMTTAIGTQIQSVFGSPPPFGPPQLAGRAQSQTCAGCHQLTNNKDLGAGLVWPSSVLLGAGGFMHVRETGILSPAMTNVFLPQRKAALESFLACGG